MLDVAKTALLCTLTGCGGLYRYPEPVAVTDTGPVALAPLCDRGAPNAICITEAMSRNDSTVQAPTGWFTDWIELQNTGSEPVQASSIRVQIGGSNLWTLAGRPLEPGATPVFWADGQELTGHIPYSISREGETIRVWVDGELSDILDVPALGSDIAYGRYADGLDTSCSPSPGVPNGAADPCPDIRERVFELGAIHDFSLTIDPANQAILESSTTFDHPLAVASFGFDAGDFQVVEVHLKGGYGSFRPDLDSQKCGFKIDLNAYQDHEWRGLNKITLNNLVQDPTFTHEFLTYELFRTLGIPAPRLAYARLTVNGVYMGFYALVESIDGAFLDDWYGGRDGHLFEAAYGPDFDADKEETFEYDSGPDEVAGRAAISAVTATLDLGYTEETYTTLRTQVDMDEWMLNMAVEAATWHWDGYWTENNNRMYLDPATGVWTIIAHGADQTWVDGWPNPYDGSSQPRLYDFCMNVPSCRAMYADKLREVADALDNSQLEAHLDALIALTEPEFAVDPRVEEADQRAGQLVGTRARIQTAAAQLRAAAQ